MTLNSAKICAQENNICIEFSTSICDREKVFLFSGYFTSPHKALCVIFGTDENCLWFCRQNDSNNTLAQWTCVLVLMVNMLVLNGNIVVWSDKKNLGGYHRRCWSITQVKTRDNKHKKNFTLQRWQFVTRWAQDVPGLKHGAKDICPAIFTLQETGTFQWGSEGERRSQVFCYCNPLNTRRFQQQPEHSQSADECAFHQQGLCHRPVSSTQEVQKKLCRWGRQGRCFCVMFVAITSVFCWWNDECDRKNRVRFIMLLFTRTTSILLHHFTRMCSLIPTESGVMLKWCLGFFFHQNGREQEKTLPSVMVFCSLAKY